jgi:hypothetical protein
VSPVPGLARASAHSVLPTADKAGPVGSDGRLRVRDFCGIDVKGSPGVATNRPEQSTCQWRIVSWTHFKFHGSITTASRFPAVSAATMAAGSSSS